MLLIPSVDLPDLPPHPDGGMWSLGMGLTRNGAPMVCKESSCVYYDAGSDSWKSGRDLQRPKSRASTARAKGGTWYIIGGTRWEGILYYRCGCQNATSSNFFSCSSATTDKILPTGEQVRYISASGLVGWFIQRFMSSLMSVFSQTAGSKKGLFSIPSPCMTKFRNPGLTHLCDLEHLLAGR